MDMVHSWSSALQCTNAAILVFSATPSMRVDLRGALAIEYSAGHPTMPASDEQGRPTARPLGTDEMKAWTALLFQRKGIEVGTQRYTSHSCKSTVLSWVAKYGISWDDRCVLGGHVAHLKSPIIYSRDALARPHSLCPRNGSGCHQAWGISA